MDLIISPAQKGFFLIISKHMVIGLLIFLFIIFILSSCGKKRNIPELDYMSFILIQGGNEVSISAPLSYDITGKAVTG